MRVHIVTIGITGILTMACLLAEAPNKNHPKLKQNTGKVEFTIKLGEDFKIKDIGGSEVKAAVIEKDGAYYIRSQYHRIWKANELRDYPVAKSISTLFVRDRAIYVFSKDRADEKMAGAVYVINTHGEAVKVDDITMADLTG